MTKRVLIQSRELDHAAELAGGYVADPSKIKSDPQGELEFSAIRRYSRQHKIPMSKLTQEDYRKIGIEK